MIVQFRIILRVVEICSNLNNVIESYEEAVSRWWWR